MDWSFNYAPWNDWGLSKMLKHRPVAWLRACVCVPWFLFRHKQSWMIQPWDEKYFLGISQGKMQNFLGRLRNISALSYLTQKYSDHVKKSEYIEECWSELRVSFFIYFCVLLTEVRRRTQRFFFFFLKRNLSITELENSSKTFFIISTQYVIPSPRRFTPSSTHA